MPIHITYHIIGRCDPYGNVVSRYASSEAMCAFELDHVFPWSRGGLSVPANFMAVHFGANRHVKRSKIRNAFTEGEVDAMQAGLSVDKFLELIRAVVCLPPFLRTLLRPLEERERGKESERGERGRACVRACMCVCVCVTIRDLEDEHMRVDRILPDHFHFSF